MPLDNVCCGFRIALAVPANGYAAILSAHTRVMLAVRGPAIDKKLCTRELVAAGDYSSFNTVRLDVIASRDPAVPNDKDAVLDVFGVNATYLMKDENRQPNDFTPELSRRARGIEFWAALKSLGAPGVASIIDRSCLYARRFADGLSVAGYKIRNDVVLNQVVFVADDEAHTSRAMNFIQSSGRVWLGPTTWKNEFAMRISVSSAATTREDIEESLLIMSEAYAATKHTS